MIDPATLILSLMLAAQPQPAEETQATEETQAPAATPIAAQDEKAADDDDKIICRRETVIGTKFKKRICGTRKQWATLEDRGTETTRQLQRRGKGQEPIN